MSSESKRWRVRRALLGVLMMRQRLNRNRVRRKPRRLLEEPESGTATSARADRSGPAPLSPFYAAEPVMDLRRRAPSESQRPPAVEALAGPEPAPTVQGVGEQRQMTAFAGGRTLRLRGRTDGAFDGDSFHTEDVQSERGTGCRGCPPSQCLHVTGVLVANYSVTTTVTLPSVNDFLNLTPCQRRRVQDAIDNVLAPHEQAHVAAFNTYDGVTRQPFDLTLCRQDFNAAIRRLFTAEERARRAAAQAASDALDPFHFDVDLNCEDQPTPRSAGQTPGAEEQK